MSNQIDEAQGGASIADQIEAWISGDAYDDKGAAILIVNAEEIVAALRHKEADDGLDIVHQPTTPQDLADSLKGVSAFLCAIGRDGMMGLVEQAIGAIGAVEGASRQSPDSFREIVRAMIEVDGGMGSKGYHAGKYYDARQAVLDMLKQSPAQPVAKECNLPKVQLPDGTVIDDRRTYCPVDRRNSADGDAGIGMSRTADDKWRNNHLTRYGRRKDDRARWTTPQPPTPAQPSQVEKTLRDEFAMAALPGLWVRRWGDDDGVCGPDVFTQVANAAYVTADAMMTRRLSPAKEKGEGE